MQIVPLKAVPAQTLLVPLTNQDVQLNIYQKLTGLFMDVYANNSVIILGVQCENANRIVRNSYLGFVGDFIFVDTQGQTNPNSSGLGTRYQLQYLTEADLEALAQL